MDYLEVAEYILNNTDNCVETSFTQAPGWRIDKGDMSYVEKTFLVHLNKIEAKFGKFTPEDCYKMVLLNNKFIDADIMFMQKDKEKHTWLRLIQAISEEFVKYTL